MLVSAEDWWVNLSLVSVFIVSYGIEHMNIKTFVHAKVYFVQAKGSRDALKLSENLKLANIDLKLSLANERVSQGESELKAKCSMVKKSLSVDINISYIFFCVSSIIFYITVYSPLPTYSLVSII